MIARPDDADDVEAFRSFLTINSVQRGLESEDAVGRAGNIFLRSENADMLPLCQYMAQYPRK